MGDTGRVFRAPASRVCAEAIRLARLVSDLLPPCETEPAALLALMLLHDSRSAARAGSDGEIVLLEEQDRSLWNADQIREGTGLARSALQIGGARFYAVRAAIAAPPRGSGVSRRDRLATDIGALRAPSRAGSFAGGRVEPRGRRRQGLRPKGGTALARRSAEPRRSARLPPAPRRARAAARAPVSPVEAAEAYRRALALVTNEAERRFLQRRLARMEEPR